ncbi:MAG: hypothetical protein JST16_01330 [Bdellovibrionales bacterium]|nr:hypothetical protein [Bdellovibrionales bacterium]
MNPQRKIWRVALLWVLSLCFVLSAGAQPEAINCEGPLRTLLALLPRVSSADPKFNRYLAESRPTEAAWVLADAGRVDDARKLLAGVEQQLQTGQVVGPLLSIDNENLTETYVVALDNGLHGVFKPDPEYWRKKCINNCFASNSQHEIAAYRMDNLLGTFVVPPTVPRTIQGMKGSLQYFVKGAADPELNPKTTNESAMRLLDYIIFNRDRHLGNWLNFEGRAVGIDHGLTFEATGTTGHYHGLPRTKAAYQNPGLYESMRKVSDGEIRSTLKGWVEPRLIEDVVNKKREVQSYMQQALYPPRPANLLTQPVAPKGIQ